MSYFSTLFCAILGRGEQTPRHGDNTPSTASYELAAVQQMAAEGRKLAIYDRATGLYAYWYLQLRADEEISRSARYEKPLSCVDIWAETPDAIEGVRAALKGELLRDNDLAGYLNNGHFVILLPETAAAGADIVLDRMRTRFGSEISGARVSFPADGKSFDALLERAKAQNVSAAAATQDDAA